MGVYGFGLIGARFYTTVGRVRAPEKINKQNREARFYTTRWGVYGLQRSTWARSTQPLGVYGLQESIRARFYTAIWRVRAPGKKMYKQNREQTSAQMRSESEIEK